MDVKATCTQMFIFLIQGKHVFTFVTSDKGEQLDPACSSLPIKLTEKAFTHLAQWATRLGFCPCADTRVTEPVIACNLTQLCGRGNDV